MLNAIKIAKIKNNAINLRVKYQLPFELVHAINCIDLNTNEEVIRYLLSQCEHCLRITNYYRKYKDIEVTINNQIKVDLKKLNFKY